MAFVVRLRSRKPTFESRDTRLTRFFRTSGSPPVSRRDVTPKSKATSETRTISSKESSALGGWNVMPTSGMQ